MKDYTLKDRSYIIISTVVLILLWKITSIMVGRSIIIPSPEETLENLVTILMSTDFLRAVMSTLTRVLIGFSLSFLLALILGIISAFVTPFYYLLKPIVLLQKSVPTMAIILLAIIWLDSEMAPILVGFLVIFPIIYSAVVQGVRDMDPKLIEMANVYELSVYTKVMRIYIPAIRSSLFSVISTALGLNLKITIAAEVLSQPNISIGTSFQIEKSTLNTAGVFAWSLIAIFIAALFDMIIKYFKKKYVHH
ncbi:ABC transporter permease [Anaeromicrobium sediminis]|uniref:ABC transporter permease n=1 Tax=Anaeromicrobium sediminis TaxID=1478221 RepID=A0A267MM58_9FIRM|nr:ABC transporter permease subunit [Anaeromicrobium sediminis]PAB60679.1 ABC transporter permease [Anaeromicrobium sediminis]